MIKRGIGLFFVFAFLLIFLLMNISADKPDFPGVWTIWGGGNIPANSYYKGTVLTAYWSDLEKSKGNFNWAALDNQINIAANNGLYVTFMIYAAGFTGGSSSRSIEPDWLYTDTQNPVDKTQCGNMPDYFPYYLDPDYSYHLNNMIIAVRNHVNSYPENVRNKVIAVQIPVGQSGDMKPYGSGCVPLSPNVSSKDNEWTNYFHNVQLMYYNAYKNTNPPIVPLYNVGTSTEENWLKANLPFSWRKSPQITQGYSARNEMNHLFKHDTASEFYDIQGTSWSYRTRGEYTTAWMGENYAHLRWFREAPIWNVYWQGLFLLSWGYDIWNVRSNMFDDVNSESFKIGFDFFAKYAGYKEAQDSKGAWIGLRDNLNSADTTRFPILNGKESTSNYSCDLFRYKRIRDLEAAKIAAAGFPEYVPVIGDENILNCSPPYKWLNDLSFITNLTALNDVGFNTWNINDGNYGMFLEQKNPTTTSQGYYRVGSKNQPYGRYARGFDYANGKNTMAFDLNDGFMYQHDGSYSVSVRVVYFDKGTGSWKLNYDSTSGVKTAYTLTKTNSGLWKEKTVTINDVYFGNRGTYGSDILLVNSDSENDIFHMIEVTRTEGDRKGYWGGSPSDFIPSDPPSTGNLIKNSDFESGTTSWTFFTDGAGTFTSASPGFSSSNSAKISISSTGANIQLYQYDIPLQPVTEYELSFDAYSNTGHDLEVYLQKHDSPYTNYGLSKQFDLANSWKHFSYRFTTSGFSSAVTDARLRFWFSTTAQAGDDFRIDNVVLKQYVGGSNCIHKSEIPPCDGKVKVNELMSFISRWKNNEIGITISDIISSIDYWKKDDAIVPNSGDTRGRAKIVNNVLVADNGALLRGAHSHVHDFAYNQFKNLAWWTNLRDNYNLNTVRLMAFLGSWPNSTETFDLNKLLPRLDIAVDNAEAADMYIIIDDHSNCCTGYDYSTCMEFWNAVAPRYKDQPNVIYEIKNEPGVYSTVEAIKFQEDLYQLVRSKAPDTPIISWSFHIAYDTMLSTVKKTNVIDYSNTVVGMHPYYGNNFPAIEALRNNGYPVIITEFSYGWGNDPSLTFEYAENNGVSWIYLDGTGITNPSYWPVTWEKDPFYT